jgi:hypothetical protein
MLLTVYHRATIKTNYNQNSKDKVLEEFVANDDSYLPVARVSRVDTLFKVKGISFIFNYPTDAEIL